MVIPATRLTAEPGDSKMTDLTPQQRIDLYYWMRLTRTFDDRMGVMWRQGRGLGAAYSQRGHEGVSVGAASALGPDDIVAPMHRDLGCYLRRGLLPERILGNMLGRVCGVTGGRDPHYAGMGDLSLGIIGFISHLPHSMPVSLGAAMAAKRRGEARVALTFTGDGAASAGLFHETLNLASLFDAPYIVVVENNQYAFSTPLNQQTKVPDIALRATAYGMPGVIVDGNDVEAMYRAVSTAAERARGGGGPTLIEAKTMRMRGHAIHDGAEYVPEALLAEWELRDPVERYREKLLEARVVTERDLDDILKRTEAEMAAAIAVAESSPMPDPSTVLDRVYAGQESR
jgi:TPP-dependent pyruvate/acetoin dehydrogenase alpha subunit